MDARQRPDDPGTWEGDHNNMCEPPTTSRTVHQSGNIPPGNFYQMGEVVWWCAPAGPDTGHLMTSGHTAGYMHIDFMPDQVFPSVSRVCWDQNLTSMPTKWTQVTVINEDQFQTDVDGSGPNLAGGLNIVTPEQQAGPGQFGIRLTGDAFMFEMLQGSTQTFVGQDVIAQNYFGWTTQDEAARYKHCITDLENGTVRIEMFNRPDRPNPEVRVQAGSFPDGPARVIFQDVSYDPDQAGPVGDDHLTWHWDNIQVYS